MKSLMKSCFVFLAALTLSCTSAFAAVKGRVDAGYVQLRMRLLESGNVINKINMGGGRVDTAILPFEGYGVALKTSTTVATSGGHGDLFSNSIGLAHYTPLTKKWAVMPIIGWTHTNLRSVHDLRALNVSNIQEKIRSNTLFIGTDIVYTINDCWTITGIAQYGWAWSKTFLKTNETFLMANQVLKGESQGFNGGVVVDYYFCENISANLAWGYNSTLSKERHGLRATGWKGGLSYMF